MCSTLLYTHIKDLMQSIFALTYIIKVGELVKVNLSTKSAQES